MKDQLVCEKTAELAKEMGFNWECEESYQTLVPPKFLMVDYTYIPTQSLLQKWLREEKKIEVLVSWEKTMGWFYAIGYLYTPDEMVEKGLDDFSLTNDLYKTYEDALEEGLKAALKYLKK